MLLPFQRKTFVTSLNVDDAKSAVRAVINERVKFAVFSSTRFTGSMNGKAFNIRRWHPVPIGIPSIAGIIRDEKPVNVELRAVPSFVLMAFLSIFPIVFVPLAFNADEMTINGITRVPELSERVYFALAGILIPAFIFCFSSIFLLLDLERRLKEGLMLREVSNSRQ